MKSANVRRKNTLEQDGKDWEGVAIIGYTPHRDQAPFENPKWKKWGLNDLYLDLPVISHTAVLATRDDLHFCGCLEVHVRTAHRHRALDDPHIGVAILVNVDHELRAANARHRVVR